MVAGGQNDHFTNPTMHWLFIPNALVCNEIVHTCTFLTTDVFWDIWSMHCGICKICWYVISDSFRWLNDVKILCHGLCWHGAIWSQNDHNHRCIVEIDLVIFFFWWLMLAKWSQSTVSCLLMAWCHVVPNWLINAPIPRPKIWVIADGLESKWKLCSSFTAKPFRDIVVIDADDQMTVIIGALWRLILWFFFFFW